MIKKIVIFFVIAALLFACGLGAYVLFGEEKREVKKARLALIVLDALNASSDDFLKEKGLRPNEMLDIKAPVKSTPDFNFQFNRNGANAYRTPMYEKYRLHKIYKEYKGRTPITGKVICDVYDMDYEYVCLSLGGTFLELNPDAYALKRFILP